MTLSRTLYFSILMIVMFYVGVDLYSPSLPAISHSLKVDTEYARWSITLFIIIFSVNQLLFGSIINRYSHKKLAIVSSIIFIIGSLICSLSPNIIVLYLGRILQGVGVSCLFPIGFATIKNNLHGDALEKGLSINSLVYTVLASIAPIIGSYITIHLGWRANFGTMLIVSLLLLLSIILLFKSSNEIETEVFSISKMISGYTTLCKNHLFIINSILAVNTLIATISYYTIIPFIIVKTFGGSLKLFGWMSLGFVVMSVIGRFIHLIFLRRYLSNLSAVLLFSVTMLIASSLMLLQQTLTGMSLISFIVYFSVIIFSGGVINPNCQTLAFKHISKSEVGYASVLYGSVSSAYIALSSMLAASIPSTLISLCVIVVILSFISTVASGFQWKKNS